MLYECWKRIAREHSGEIALRDIASGNQWTFSHLCAATEKKSPNDSSFRCPSGNGPQFIFALLQAWRQNSCVCPVEAGQAPPTLKEWPSGIAHLKITSATSGKARTVAFTAAQLAADARNIVATMGLRPDQPNIGAISLAHSYGFSNLVLPLLLHGIPLTLVDSHLPERILRAATGLTQATLPAVPALWRSWLEAKSIPPTVRLAISAGAPLPLALEHQAFNDHQLKIHNFYGATECGGIAYDNSEVPRTDAQYVGTAMKHVTLSLNDQCCLRVESDAVGECYWPNKEENLGKGQFLTGDLASIENGRVCLHGRVTDQINIAGRKVPPETIERVLRTHPTVQDCLVFGALSPDAERSEQIVACIVSNSSLPTAETLRQFLLTKLPAWQIPREWRFVESLTTNRRGKLSRTDWRQRLGFAAHTAP